VVETVGHPIASAPPSGSVRVWSGVLQWRRRTSSLFGWLVADGWCWFVLREEYYWLVTGDWFVLREKYCWPVADKPSEQGARGLSLWPPLPLIVLCDRGPPAF
jgi:hypothetical protein